MANRRILGRAAAFGVAMLGFCPAAQAGSFKELLSVVFFENEIAYKDVQNFFCRHILLQADGDYCRVTFEILEPETCKVGIDRDIRATWGDGKGRDFILAKDVWTLANVDISRTRQEYVADLKAARLLFEGVVEVHRHEGHNYAFELDDKGNYAACRSEGATLAISERECIDRGTKALTISNKMSLLFQRFGSQKGLDAMRTLLSEHCKRAEIKS